MNQIKENRFRVRTLLGKNMVVEAGAGTGKTTILIDRLCFALLAQGVPASRLVALTFTEKAGAEIKTRLIFKLQAVLRALREGSTEPILQDLQEHFGIARQDIIARAEAALQLIDRSCIGTIHSFCADILRAYPLQAGLTPHAEIDKGPRRQAVFDAQWNQFLDEELGVNATRAELWKEILSMVKLQDLRACAFEMCKGKVEEYDCLAQKDLLARVFDQRAGEARYLAQAFLKEGQKPRSIEEALLQTAQRFENAAHWLRGGEITEPLPPQSITYIPKGWDEQSKQEAKDLCAFAQQIEPSIQARIVKIYDLLGEFVSQVRMRCTQEGILGFDDLLVKTRNLLKNNLQVRNYLKETYDVFFIDEFQDTDPVQGELLLFLAEKKNMQASRWEDIQLQSGKLFVVGDPKQSIYRFRGADIAAYEMFTDLILKQGGEKAYLQQNFRSEREIIALANDVCAAAMKEKPGFQPLYEPIFTEKKELNQAAGLALICAGEEKVLAEPSRLNQGRWIAQWIEENVGKMTLKNGQKLQYKDIALLARSTTSIYPYTDALRRRDIPFLIEADQNFYKRQEIHDFLNILRVLHNPHDRISLVGVMRSALGAMSDEEIYQAAQAGELDYRKPARLEKLERLFAWLRSFAERVGREPLRQLLSALMQESFLRESCCYAYDGERSIATLEKLVSLAVGYTLQKPATLGQFLSALEQLMEQELNRLTALPETEALNAVNLMSIHKSKGLEFPVVILLDICKKDQPPPEKRPLHLYSWQYQLHGFRVGPYADMNFAWLEEEDKKHSLCEEVRLLYVALTRAREKIWAVGNLSPEKKTFALMFLKAGRFPAQDQRPERLGNEEGWPIVYEPYVAPEKFIYTMNHAEIPPQTITDFSLWKQACRSRKEAYEKRALADSARYSCDIDSPDKYNEQALQSGTLVHQVLAYFWQNPQEGWEKAWLVGLKQNAAVACQTHAREMVSAYTQSPLFQSLRRKKTLGVELPFYQYSPQGFVSGVMDLLLQDEDGTLWVMDYKTDKVNAGQENQAACKYALQLQTYKQAAAALYPGKKVRAGVIFLRTCQMAEV